MFKHLLIEKELSTVKSTDSEARQPGLDLGLCHFLGHLPNLCASLPIC